MRIRNVVNLALTVALLLSLVACGADEPVAENTKEPVEIFTLAGLWERAESTYTSLDGMVIEVMADETEAVIVTVPENEFMFQAGDVKWRSIEPIGPNEYAFEDLVRQSGSGATSYVEGVISVTGDGTLEMSFPTTGTLQAWVRATG